MVSLLAPRVYPLNEGRVYRLLVAIPMKRRIAYCLWRLTKDRVLTVVYGFTNPAGFQSLLDIHIPDFLAVAFEGVAPKAIGRLHVHAPYAVEVTAQYGWSRRKIPHLKAYNIKRGPLTAVMKLGWNVVYQVLKLPLPRWAELLVTREDYSV